MQVIPLTAVPSQTVSVLLAEQDCTIAIYQKATGMYLDLYVSGALVLGGIICRNNTRIVRDAYHGFVGDLFVTDNDGAEDPAYAGLGSRFFLLYLEASELT